MRVDRVIEQSPLLRARVAGQAGLVTRAQAVAAGTGPEAIRWAVSSGRWVAMHPGVYLTVPGRDDWEVRAVAALLFVGGDVALAGESAALAWGIERREPEAVQVVVPAGRRASMRPDIEMSRSRMFACLRDVERAHGLPTARRQEPLGDSRRCDNFYEAQQLLIEIDGRLGHEGWSGRVRDGLRDRAAAQRGRLTVRGYWSDVAVTPCAFALEVSTLLRLRGWTGVPRPCRRRDCAARGRRAA